MEGGERCDRIGSQGLMEGGERWNAGMEKGWEGRRGWRGHDGGWQLWAGREGEKWHHVDAHCEA